MEHLLETAEDTITILDTEVVLVLVGTMEPLEEAGQAVQDEVELLDRMDLSLALDRMELLVHPTMVKEGRSPINSLDCDWRIFKVT